MRFFLASLIFFNALHLVQLGGVVVNWKQWYLGIVDCNSGFAILAENYGPKNLGYNLINQMSSLI